jgi:hypothetical protein
MNALALAKRLRPPHVTILSPYRIHVRRHHERYILQELTALHPGGFPPNMVRATPESAANSGIMDPLNTQLEHLVHNRHFTAATALLTIMETQQIPVRRRAVYEAAALHAIQVDETDIGGFAKWLNSSPDCYEHPPDRSPFRILRHALLYTFTPRPRQGLIHHFTVIIATKGYREIVFEHILPFYRRHMSVETRISFIRLLEQALRDYYRMERLKRGHTFFGIPLRAYIVDVCRRNGWEEEARVFEEERILMLQAKKKWDHQRWMTRRSDFVDVDDLEKGEMLQLMGMGLSPCYRRFSRAGFLLYPIMKTSPAPVQEEDTTCAIST